MFRQTNNKWQNLSNSMIMRSNEVVSEHHKEEDDDEDDEIVTTNIK
jgi:hypothetical protein